jgi:RHS repeat-associated protein
MQLGAEVERVRHGYDRGGNRLWRECPVAAASGKHLEELYGYDSLDQLLSMGRGDLNEGGTALVPGTKKFAESWTLDATGNWLGYRRDEEGDGVWELDQSRTHSAANEIVTLGDSPAHAAHDRVGNMTRTMVGTEANHHFDLTYDAWNRLVRVSDSETHDIVTEYNYDGRGVRIAKRSYTAGQLDQTRHYYYSSRWQVLEERIGDCASANRQFVWGLRHVDDLVLRDRDATGYGALDERLYALQDPNWNVTALAQRGGAIAERYAYSAYGEHRTLSADYVSRAESHWSWEYVYTARSWDADVNLGHYRTRDYHPSLGRFTARDFHAAAGASNVYAYVDNSPTRSVDPLGMQGVAAVPPDLFEALFLYYEQTGISSFTTAEFMKWYSNNYGMTLTDAQLGHILGRGCIGLCFVGQSGCDPQPYDPDRNRRDPRWGDPARRPDADTKCYLEQGLATGRSCPAGTENFTFARQGTTWRGDAEPTPDPDDSTVPGNSILSAGSKNYAIIRGSLYLYMDSASYPPHCLRPRMDLSQPERPNDPQHFIISSDLPYADATIYCSTCVCKGKNRPSGPN